MANPVLHLLAGPNGAGKSTLFEEIIGRATGLEFVNADAIAAQRWPDDPLGHSYEAAAAAHERRQELIQQQASFATETGFSHDSKLELVQSASELGYLITLHIVLVPEQLAVARVRSRVDAGGHPVPEAKIRTRYQRLWPLVAEAIKAADKSIVYDNSQSSPAFRVVASFERGSVVGKADWPSWAPKPLRQAGDP